jgi:riboflavin synthase alpha subunit
LKVTTFGGLTVGAQLNIEVDPMARYAARLLDAAKVA